MQCTSKLADDCQSFHVNPLVDIHIKLIAIKSKKSWKITKGELLTISVVNCDTDIFHKKTLRHVCILLTITRSGVTNFQQIFHQTDGM